MMKNLFHILSAILLPLGLMAQAPAPYPILVDSQRDTVAALQVFQANAITFRASFKSGGTANSIVTETPFMYWQPFGATNATVVTAQWTIVSAPSGMVDFAFTPASLNYAAGTYTYQVGLDQSGGPLVIKQGTFKINPSAASTGADPIVFASTNVNWGSINWTGLPDYEYRTNTIAVSNSLNAQIVSASNALNTRVTANETGKVARAGDTMTGNLEFTNAGLTSLDFATFDTAPTGAISQARMQWQSGRQTIRLGLNANVNLDVGQQVILYARNEETNTLSIGEVVFVAGANGDNPTIKRASNASEALSARTIGITAEEITVNASGHVVTKGTVYGLNTTNFTQGANLYLGANGTVQTNLPAAPLHGVFVGVVERVHPNVGQIYVAIQNYQELRELSDVFVNGVANNDLIVYNAASSRWQNATLASLGITTGGGITVESDPIFVAASNSFYPRSNPSNFITTAALSGYATGTPLYVETDPTAVTNVTASGRITATPSGKQVALTFDASGLATGAPLYAFTETDTIATNLLTNYYTITAADAKFATGTPLFVENDPALTNFLALGGTINGSITATNGILVVTGMTASAGKSLRIKAGDATTDAANLILQGGVGTLIGTTGNVVISSVLQPNSGIKPNTGVDLQLIGGNGSMGPPTESGDVIISGGTGGSSEGQIYATSVFNLNDNLVLTNSDIFMFGSGSYGLKLRPNSGEGSSDGDSKPIYFTSRNNAQENTATLFKRRNDDSLVYQYNGQDRPVLVGNAFNNSSTYLISGQIDLQGRIRLVDSNSITVGWITSTGGVQIGAASFKAELSGNISQDSTNTAALGIVTATSLSGNHIGNAANLTNFPQFLATTSSLALVEAYTNRAASALSSSVWASADSTTNYASRITFNATSNSLNTRLVSVEAYTSRIVAVEGYTNRAASALASSVWASADSTTNYQSRVQFVASSNSLSSRISNVATGAVYTTNLSFIAGIGLTASNNQLRVTNVVTSADVNAYTTTNFAWAAQPATQIVNANSNIIYNVQRIAFLTNQQATSEFHNIFVASTSGSGAFTNALVYSKGPGNASRIWTASDFSKDVYLTISAGNTNYARRTSVPASNTAFGLYNQFAIDNTNLYFYHEGSSKWLRVSGTLEW